MDLNEEDIYVRKYQYLNEYSHHVFESNRRLQHRIYHVKKEINHLKRLKRTLCERLMRHKSVLVDFNLEIPDEDSGDHATPFSSSAAGPSSNDGRTSRTLTMTGSNGSSVMGSAPPPFTAASSSTSIDWVIGEVVTSAASAYSFASPASASSRPPPSSAPPKQRRRRAPNADAVDGRRRERPPQAPKLSLNSATERNIIAIIDSVVNETHDDALRDAAQQSTAGTRPTDEERTIDG